MNFINKNHLLPAWRIALSNLMVLFSFQIACSQQDTTKKIPDGTDGLFLTVHPTDSSINKLPPNEFEGSKASFKIGMGFILDYTNYIQSDVFKEQMSIGEYTIEPKFKTRDFRILGSGRFKTKRSLAFKFAYMWDGDKDTWLVRESGFTIGVPELAGHIFIGRTKEGFSLVKVMNGHSPWSYERLMAIDLIPIMADGIKWFGYLPKSRIFWNLGYFNDVISKGQGSSTYAWQAVARVGFLPVFDQKNNKVLHLGANLRYGEPLNGKITLKSRPESNITPQILNTGEFKTDYSTHFGAEIYYSTGRILLGSESYMHKFYSADGEAHTFMGGDITLTYLFTGGPRPYNTVGSIFGFVPVKKSVFKGGLGEIEGVIKYSVFNLNDGSIKGGKFWRITPMINWYLTKIMRMEFVYGYGVLDRYNLSGAVQFFESRIQFTIL